MAAPLRRLLAPQQLRQLRRASSEVARTSTSVPGATAPKVEASTIKLTAIAEAQGQKRYVLRGLLGQTLLKTLARSELIDPNSHLLEDVSTCGAECEVSVSSEWLQKLPPRSEAEMEVLTRSLADGREHEVDIHTRLSCQIVLDKSLDGMAIAIPEPRPWRTN